MILPKKVFIFGSCVSRDPFELSGKGQFDIVGYFARSSFASLTSKPIVNNELISAIPSNWQKRMVYSDMNKSILNTLELTDFDILLIDLVDERFNLNKSKEGIHTISSEYRKAAIYCGFKMNVVPAFSNEKFDIWKKGVDIFFLKAIESGFLEKIVINEVYFSKSIDDVNDRKDKVGIWTSDRIDLANHYLEKMYDYISSYIDKNKYIQYPSYLNYSDSNHKWNLSPFHFNKEFQLFQVKSLLEI